ncbi:MAG: hypothetical protein RBT75_06885 [Anaerolineae bacterium]|jgi:hypothetical protein|nr:hypothetical protein [Anaerolineae bacterium]
MLEATSARKPVTDWLTVGAIAAIAISLNVALHEGVHALTCLAVGGRLQAYSALYVSCASATTFQEKAVAGSAPTFNLIAGAMLWTVLRNSRRDPSASRFFLWLLMLMNSFYGAGYLIFSGIANIGDWAVVLNGWEPGGLWRVLLVLAGALLFAVCIRLTLQELGRMVGSSSNALLRRATQLCAVAYGVSVAVVLLAGFFCPDGLLSLPVTAGVAAVTGALSPLLWMPRWLPATSPAEPAEKPLEIHRQARWLIAASIVVFAYVYLLGRTLVF